MTRTEELALRLTEGSISAEQASELEVLIKSPANRKCLVDLLGLHHDLSAGEEQENLPESVMHEISSQISCRISGNVGSMIERQKMKSIFYRRVLPLAAAAALVAAAGFGWLFVSGTGSDETAGGAIVARVVDVNPLSSAISWQSPEEPGRRIRQRAKNGMALRSGMRIETFQGGGMTIAKIEDGTKVELAGASMLAIEDSGRPVLRRGRLVAHVTRQLPGSRFAVETPHAVVTVVGTVFSLDAGDGGTLVSPTEGVVRILSKKSGAEVLAVKGMHVAVLPDGMIKPGSEATPTVKYGKLPAEIRSPRGIATDGKILWALSVNSTIFAVDPETMEISKRMELGPVLPDIGAIAYSDGFLWVAANNMREVTLARVSPDDGAVNVLMTFRRKSSNMAGDMAVACGGGAVWTGVLLEDGRYEVSRWNPDTGAVVERFYNRTGNRICKLMWMDGGLWRLDGLAAYRMDLVSGRDTVALDLDRGRGWLVVTGVYGNRFWSLVAGTQKLAQRELLFAELPAE